MFGKDSECKTVYMGKKSKNKYLELEYTPADSNKYEEGIILCKTYLYSFFKR